MLNMLIFSRVQVCSCCVVVYKGSISEEHERIVHGVKVGACSILCWTCVR
jgi:hypothetical protein